MQNLSTPSKMENAWGSLLTDDQYFLLYFIMGTYFGPDIKNEKRRISALQRLVEGLPLYESEDLSNSQIKIGLMKSVYYYVLREAEKAVVVNKSLLLQFIHGNLEFPCYPRFDELFPPALHWRSHFKNQHDTIGNVVFIENPEINYIRPVDIARFMHLTRLKDFHLDRESAISHVFGGQNSLLHNIKVEQAPLRLDDVMQEFENYAVSYTDANSNGNLRSDSEVPLTNNSLENGSPLSYRNGGSKEDFYPGTIFIPCRPSSKEEWSEIVGSVKGGFALTGSAARQHVGPVLGLMDIGESEDAYLFRVSLPGVRRDEREFNCEVETNGTVLIKGVTVTGERTVERHSQVFQMQTHNLCPPGPFSISFKLPGPVDPRQFHGTFATDGILEGIALKTRRHIF